MGNSPTCVDCDEKVPKTVRFFDKIIFCNGRYIYERFTYIRWTQIDNGYICPNCLTRRNNQVKQREEERRREEQRQAEERKREQRQAEKRRQEEQQRQEERSRIEEERRRIEEERRRIEEERRRIEEERRQIEEERRQIEEQRRLIEEERKQREQRALVLQEKEKIDSYCREIRVSMINQHTKSKSTRLSCSEFKLVDKIQPRVGDVPNLFKNILSKQFPYKNRNKYQRPKGKPRRGSKSKFKLLREIESCSLVHSGLKEEIKEFLGVVESDRYSKKILIPLSRARYHTCQQIKKICFSVERTKKYWPRHTQLISLYIMINAFNTNKGGLLQINTGEGKTCIVAMFAAYVALSNTSVDVISSSPVLAERDSKEWAVFYRDLGITVKSNLTQKETEERFECYQHRVVYGTVGSFASDILRQEFQMENVRGDRKFEVVIVDEVDCLLLDQSIHFTYLSDSAAGLHHLEPVLLMIWNEIIRHPIIQSNNGKQFHIGKAEPFNVLLSKVIDLPDSDVLHILCNEGILSKSCLSFQENQSVDTFNSYFNKEIMCMCFLKIQTLFDISFDIYDMTDVSAVQLLNWSNFKSSKRNHYNVMLVGEGRVCFLYEDMQVVFELIKDKIEAFININSQDPEQVKHEIPKYLLDFVKTRIPEWIENAFIAKYKISRKKQYIVKDKEIVPVDFQSTGVVELDTKWGDGLHQFLEIKHKKKLSPMAIVTNFMSNQAFFARYKRYIFGVSGTLGSTNEGEYLSETFGLTSCKIPTFRTSLQKEHPGIACSDKTEWLSQIKNTTETRLRERRAILIICEDMNTAEEIHNSIYSLNSRSLNMYIRNDEQSKKVDEILHERDIIVATTIAGRGTDIEIDDSVSSVGGLFVLVTFLPFNMRVERQVFGRCARKGQPGSSQIILNRETVPEYLQSCHEVNDMKQIRDGVEEKRIENIRKELLPKTKEKETLFKIYCNFIRYEFLEENELTRKVYMGAMHEFWGLWLKMNTNRIPDIALQMELEVALKDAVVRLRKDFSPFLNSYHIIKFANEELLKSRFENAYNLLSKAIECDDKWAAIAYYNRAYCSLLQSYEKFSSTIQSDLRKAKERFGRFIDELELSVSLISILEKSQEQSSELETQFTTRSQILNFIVDNINETLDSLKTLTAEKKCVKASGLCLFLIMTGDDGQTKCVESELGLYWGLGLKEIIKVGEKPKFSWKGCLVALFGVIQIAVGTVVAACSTGILANVGLGLIAEGINDIVTGSLAVLKHDQNFVKSWLTGKVMSIAISIATYGFSHLKTAIESGKGVKGIITSVKAEMLSGAKELLSGWKDLPGKLSSSFAEKAFKQTCITMAKDTGMKVAEQGSKHVMDWAHDKLKQYLEKEMRNKIKEELNLALHCSGQNKKKMILLRFILFQKEAGKPFQETIACYRKITDQALASKNYCDVRQALSGCVKSILSASKKALQSGGNVWVQNALPIFDMFESLQCTTFDVKQLVSFYFEHVENAMDEIYSFKSKNISWHMLSTIEGSDKMVHLREEICNQIYELLMESFKSTSDGWIVSKFQNMVTGIVTNHFEENSIGRNTLENLFEHSKLDGNSLKGMKDLTTTVISNSTKTKPDIFRQFSSNIANEAVGTSADDKTKQKINFGLKSTENCINAVKSGDTQQLTQASLSVANEAVGTFVDDKTKQKINFGLKSTENCINAVKSGDTQQLTQASLSVANEAVGTFVDDDTVTDGYKFTMESANLLISSRYWPLTNTVDTM